MSTSFLKCICAFNRVLSCLRRTGESGVLGEMWGLLGSCGYWQVAPLHQTGPGEVPMTCFIPTLVLCRKKMEGEVESQLEYLFEAAGKKIKKSHCGKTM